MSELVERTLRHRVDGAEPVLRDVSPDRVLERARLVRRRRRAVATGVIGVAAVVATTAGLTGLHPGRGPVGPAHQAVRGHTVVLDGPLTELARGPRPGVGYGYGARLHLADGSSRPVPGGTVYMSWEPFAGGFFVLNGERLGRYVANGTEIAQYTSLAVPAVSADARRAAWVDRTGSLIVATAGGQQMRAVPGATEAAGFLPDGEVVVNVDHAAVAVGPSGPRVIPSLVAATASSESTGLVVGVLRREIGVVDARTGHVLWRTNQGVSGFSRDGRYVVATSGAPRGSTVSLLDARTGAVIRTLRVDRGVVGGARWEDSTHVLVVVEDTRRDQQVLVRFGTDGRVERATAVTRSGGASYAFAQTG